eukprot:sb/3472520/
MLGEYNTGRWGRKVGQKEGYAKSETCKLSFLKEWCKSLHILGINETVYLHDTHTNIKHMNIIIKTHQSGFVVVTSHQEPIDTSKQPIRTRYLGHVTGYQPIRDQYFLVRSVPASHYHSPELRIAYVIMIRRIGPGQELLVEVRLVLTPAFSCYPVDTRLPETTA